MEPMPLGSFERLRNNNIIQAWLVLVLALLFRDSDNPGAEDRRE